MKILNRITSIGLSLVMCAGMVLPALAVEYDIAAGDVHVESNDSGTVSWQDDHETYNSRDTGSTDSSITITQSNSETATENTITVGENVTDTSITLDNVNIDVSRNGGAAMSVSGEKTDVTVELKGENTLTSGKNHAGLELNEGASVTITSEDQGELTATGGDYGAGIGSGYYGTAGNITIKDDAVVEAYGGESFGAGIGTGYAGQLVDVDSGDPDKAGKITIEGNANVTAKGGGQGAGIGSGDKGTVGDIEISNSSTVTAEGGRYAAGIGAGYEGNAGAIDIVIRDHAAVTATGGEDAAGIGAGAVYRNGASSTVGDINITLKDHAALSATSGKGYGAGIGTGYGSAAGDITIFGESGSSVTIRKGSSAYQDISTGGTVDVRLLQADGALSYQHKYDKYVFTPPAGETITVNEDGSVIFPAKTIRTQAYCATYVYPKGAVLDENGNISKDTPYFYQWNNTFGSYDGQTLSYISKWSSGDVDIAFRQYGPTVIKIDVPTGQKGEVKVDENYVVTVVTPAGTVVTGEGISTAYPGGVTLDQYGNPIGNNASITKNEDGSVTFNDGEKDTISASVPEEMKDDVKFEVGDDGSVTVNVPAGTVVTGTDGSVYELPEGGTITGDGKVCDMDGNPVAPKKGDTDSSQGTGTGVPVIPGDTDTGTGDDDTAIDDGIVPLALMSTRGELMGCLYERAGSPDGVDAEGEYTLALAWAVAQDIVGEEDDPEEIVTVAILRDVMTRYAKLLNRTFDVEIPGEDDDVVMNCGEILEEFFA